jgi:hypothetical protein
VALADAQASPEAVQAYFREIGYSRFSSLE